MASLRKSSFTLNLLKKVMLGLVLLHLAGEIGALTFYEHDNFSGSGFQLRAPHGWTIHKQCNHIPNWANDQITSVDGEGHCVVLYDNANCEGRSVSIYRSEDLGQSLGMNDQVSSYSAC